MLGEYVTYDHGGKDHGDTTAAVIRRNYAKASLIVDPFDRAGVGKRESRHGAEGKGDLEEMHCVGFWLG
jgi:hypothetical protein